MIIDSLRTYFISCPFLRDGPFRVDSLGPEATEYTIETVPLDPILKSYADGASLRQYGFVLASKEHFGLDVAQNIDNSQFYEELCEWIETQNKERKLPILGNNLSPQEIKILTHGYVLDATEDTARYQIQLKLIYYKE